MLKIGKLTLNGTPRTVISLKDGTPSKVLQALESRRDIVELRIDRFSSRETKHVLSEIKKLKRFSLIATIRSAKEGGDWRSSEEERLEFFKAVIPLVDAVDIELSSKSILKKVIQAARQKKKLVIVSYHNFKKTPPAKKLAQIVREARSSKADIVKIAAMAESRKDVRVLAHFTVLNREKNLITVAMGPKGAISRLLFPALGSLMSYTYLDRPTAPGQLDYKTTSNFLRKLAFK